MPGGTTSDGPARPARTGASPPPLVVEGRRWLLVLAADPRSPARARRSVGAAAGAVGLGTALVDVAVVLTSELVTNALRHGDGEPFVELVAGPRGVRVGVSDSGREMPVVRSAGVEALGGRGLAILDAWADAWGVTPTAGGKTVWFELHAP